MGIGFLGDKKKPDAVRPDHYKSDGIEPIEYIAKNELDFNEGCVVKYVSRHKLRNGAEDIRKAIQYCKFILKYEYGEEDDDGD